MNYKADNKYFSARKCYEIIANCNDVISHLEVLRENGTTYTRELDNMYAEAITLRSWLYFFLIRNYHQVPYLTIDYAASGGSGDIEIWLNSNSSGNTDILKLIETVHGVLKLYDEAQITNSGYFNLASANAFLGEMYLWNNDYSNAINSLLASVETGKGSRFILDKDLENAKWLNIFKGDEGATDEIMTKIIFNKGEKQENGLLDLFSSVSPTGLKLTPLHSSIIDLTGTYRFDGTFKRGNEVGKYTRDVEDPYTSDMPVILYRAADVHLMLAEAYNRLGEISEALNLVNNGSDRLFTAGSKGVRGRVALAPLILGGFSNLQDSIKGMENLILQERSREMAFEGKRWYDILRIAERRNDSKFIGNLMMKRYPDADSTRVINFYNNKENWFLPME
jgi:Fe-S-cluster formation regulator IscX/YfhJ